MVEIKLTLDIMRAKFGDIEPCFIRMATEYEDELILKFEYEPDIRESITKRAYYWGETSEQYERHGKGFLIDWDLKTIYLGTFSKNKRCKGL